MIQGLSCILNVCLRKLKKMAISNEELETVVKNLLKQNQKEQNQEWREMVEEMVDTKLKLVEENWKQQAQENNKVSKDDPKEVKNSTEFGKESTGFNDDHRPIPDLEDRTIR